VTGLDRLSQDGDDQQWFRILKETFLKETFRQRQLKAAVTVNTALLEFYWHLGGEIVAKQKNCRWGGGLLSQLSRDLMTAFPDVKGFSKRNLEQIRKWYRYWSTDNAIAQQAVSQLFHELLYQSGG
jgi:hypothetical protein